MKSHAHANGKSTSKVSVEAATQRTVDESTNDRIKALLDEANAWARQLKSSEEANAALKGEVNRLVEANAKLADEADTMKKANAEREKTESERALREVRKCVANGTERLISRFEQKKDWAHEVETIVKPIYDFAALAGENEIADAARGLIRKAERLGLFCASQLASHRVHEHDERGE